MKPEWKAFLENKGAELADGRVDTFGNPERELRMVTAGDVIADLSHFGLISAHGEDAAGFLQGQLTNDIRNVTGTHSQLSAHLSPKGRMLANFRVFTHDEAFYLLMPREQVEAVLKRLRMFVLASKVSLEDASDTFAHFGFSGPKAETELREHLGGVPDQPDDTLVQGEITVVRVPGPHPRFELFGGLEAMQNLWTVLDVRAAPVGASCWALLDVLAGIPTIVPETADEFVPQMANLQLIGGVSFTKGCYTGQEIVARTEHLGKLKRRMYRAHADVEDCPGPGEPVYRGGGEGAQSAGKVVNALPSPEGGCELLAVVEIARREAGDVHLGGPDGPALEFRDLPYDIEQE